MTKNQHNCLMYIINQGGSCTSAKLRLMRYGKTLRSLKANGWATMSYAPATYHITGEGEEAVKSND